MKVDAAAEVSEDSFYHGLVKIAQPRRGYRFAVDSPILADFLPAAATPALEIGCGVGIVSILALHRRKFPAVTGIEIQERLAKLARRNARQNGLADRFRVIRGDFLQNFRRFYGMDNVFANPPFLLPDRGKVSSDECSRLARFEITLTLAGLLEKSAAILSASGKLCLIFPYARFSELLAKAADCDLYPRRTRLIRPFARSVPDRFLVELGQKKGKVREVPVLTIFHHPGKYTAEAGTILGEKERKTQ